jgi:hypothetical protein
MSGHVINPVRVLGGAQAGLEPGRRERRGGRSVSSLVSEVRRGGASAGLGLDGGVSGEGVAL